MHQLRGSVCASASSITDKWPPSLKKKGGGLKAYAKKGELFLMACVQEMGPGLLEEESCLPGTEDYGTTPCGMLEAARGLGGPGLKSV